MLIVLAALTVTAGAVFAQDGDGRPAAPDSPVAPSAATDVESTEQCFYSADDAYIDNRFPDTNYGESDDLELFYAGDGGDWRQPYLWFDISAIPDGASVLSADLWLYQTGGAGGEGNLEGVDSSWDEATITWNNNPPSSGNYDTVILPGDADWRRWDADQLVHEWVTGARPNHGLTIFPSDQGGATFHSDEGSGNDGPILCVTWTEEDINTDITVDGIEVTQSIQDLDNDVRLVAGKRTFVRVHASTSSGVYRTFATLEVSNGQSSYTFHPNTTGGHLNVRQNPKRDRVNHSFLFSLSDRYLTGTIQMTATVNPITSWRPNRYPPETDYGNNEMSTSVTFESVPRIGVIMHQVEYTIDDDGSTVTHTTPLTDGRLGIDWIRRAFPVDDVFYAMRTLPYHEGSLPGSGDVNKKLAQKRHFDRNHDTWDYAVGAQHEIRYYGMVDDDGGFMRGGASGHVASGPTGRGGRWDRDRRYGDWYFGHELGHTLGRPHVDGDSGPAGSCGGEKGAVDDYPFDDGYISDDETGQNAYYGFDIGSPYVTTGFPAQDVAVYDPDWRDVMTYCRPLWISEYTYEHLMDFIQSNIQPATAAPVTPEEEVDRLSVVGTINPDTSAVELEPFFVITDAVAMDARQPGDYAIVLRDDGGGELARYPFTPEPLGSGPPVPGAEDVPAVDQLLIDELVPYEPGTVQVDVEGPGGVLTSVSAGAGEPSVTIWYPNGGASIGDEPLIVSWFSSDPDDDDLTFNVEFSPDNGDSWELLAQGVTTNSVEIARHNVPGTDEGLIRVWASDGIHTSSAQSFGTFTTSDLEMTAEIVSPQTGNVYARRQTINLEALAFSPNYGALGGNQLVWTSDQDGLLGEGRQLSVSDLSPGVHDITLLATDEALITTDTVTDVVIVENPTMLPTPEEALAAGPDPILFFPSTGTLSQEVTVDNAAGKDPLQWTATTPASWLELSQTSGSTPAAFTVSVGAGALGPGTHETTITLTSDDVPEQTLELNVVATVQQPHQLYLPGVVSE